MMENKPAAEILQAAQPEAIIKVCDCVAASVDLMMYMRYGCDFSRWVRIGSRIKPDAARGAPAGKIVCIAPELPMNGCCRFQSFGFLMKYIADMNAGPEARQQLKLMEEEVLHIRKRIEQTSPGRSA